MAYKIFLETNIIVDLLIERNYHSDAINEIFILAGKEKAGLYNAESIIATTFYILRKEKRIDPLAAFREICKTMNIIPFSKNILYYCLEKDQKEDGPLY